MTIVNYKSQVDLAAELNLNGKSGLTDRGLKVPSIQKVNCLFIAHKKLRTVFDLLLILEYICENFITKTFQRHFTLDVIIVHASEFLLNTLTSPYIETVWWNGDSWSWREFNILHFWRSLQCLGKRLRKVKRLIDSKIS